jgi:hypothetical protein
LPSEKQPAPYDSALPGLDGQVRAQLPAFVPRIGGKGLPSSFTRRSFARVERSRGWAAIDARFSPTPVGDSMAQRACGCSSGRMRAPSPSCDRAAEPVAAAGLRVRLSVYGLCAMMIGASRPVIRLGRRLRVTAGDWNTVEQDRSAGATRPPPPVQVMAGRNDVRTARRPGRGRCRAHARDREPLGGTARDGRQTRSGGR